MLGSPTVWPFRSHSQQKVPTHFTGCAFVPSAPILSQTQRGLVAAHLTHAKSLPRRFTPTGRPLVDGISGETSSAVLRLGCVRGRA
jgi:hypothetical protein